MSGGNIAPFTPLKGVQRGAWGGWIYSLDLVRDHPWWWILLIPAAGGMLVGPLVYCLAREAKGHGVPEVMEAVALRSGAMRPRVVVVKSLASALTIGTGGSVGWEGPIVQIGSALGSAVGQWLRVSGARLRTLAVCGAAAGIAATFNAPVAGALFAVEIILGDFGVTQFSPIVISSVMATVISRHFLGNFPAFDVPPHEIVSAWELVTYGVLGIVAAGVALAFTRAVYASEDLRERLPVRPWLLPVFGGLVIGVIALAFPEILGVGYEATNEALWGRMGLGILAILIPVKLLATSVTLGSGGSGGIVATLITTPVRRESICTLKLIRRGVDVFRGRELNVLKSLRVQEVMSRVFSGKEPDELAVVDPGSGELVGVVTRRHLIDAYNRELLKRDMVVGLGGGLEATATDEIHLGEGYRMAELDAPGAFLGRSIRDLNVRARYGVAILLVRRSSSTGRSEGRGIVPTSDTVVERGDHLVVMGEEGAVKRLRTL